MGNFQRCIAVILTEEGSLALGAFDISAGICAEIAPRPVLPSNFDQLNGLITNDKFCLIRRGRLTLSWWRRPLRLRDRPVAVAYLHEDPVHRGGAHGTVMASAPISADEPGRGAAVGPGLPAPAALGDADRAGGD